MSATPAGARPAAFLDRDGTLNREVDGALARPEQLELLPGAGAAVRRLAEAGFWIVVVTNQSAIARGWMRHDDLLRVTRVFEDQLAAAGARADLVLHCPHHPDAGLPPYRRLCPCRKPAPGLLLEAARTLPIDLPRSWIVGDAARDLAAGDAAGVRPILVATGKGERERERAARECSEPPPFVPDLGAAAELILAELARRPQGK